MSRTVLRGLLLASLLGTLPREAPAETASPAALALRREYNQVSASIDTLVRLYGAERFDRLTDSARTPGLELPAGSSLVLLFWADDEAQVYLNGDPVGATRLTPTRIEIPAFYLQADNELVALCWDTDRVESGFMAGLYLEDGSGLRPVLTTSEGFGWEVGDGVPAQEIYYAHTQPDLPAAEVMWGPQLFGRVRLRVRFSAADVLRAAVRAPLDAGASLRDRTMDFHRLVGRLAGLEERRRELATRLEAGAGTPGPEVRFRGGASLGMGYTLGSAGPLRERVDLEAAGRVQRWARRLPSSQGKLVLRQARRLRGVEAASPMAPLADPAPGQVAADRQADYRPPAERGSSGQGEGSSTRAGLAARTVATGTSHRVVARMALIGLFLTGWTGGAGWRGWRLWRGITRKGGPV